MSSMTSKLVFAATAALAAPALAAGEEIHSCVAKELLGTGSGHIRIVASPT